MEQFTMNEYMHNPLNKGDSTLPNKELILSSLRDSYNKLVENKNITHIIYKRNLEIWYHLLIPSESNDLAYDVVIKVKLEDESSSIKNSPMEVYNNSPSFTYTYAYVFNKGNLLINELKRKYGLQVLTKPPVVRNSREYISYEKYIFYAIQYLTSNPSLLSSEYVNSVSKPLSIQTLYRTVKSPNEITGLINASKAKQKEEKQRLKKLEDKQRKEHNALINKQNKGGKSVNYIDGKKNGSTNKITPKTKIKPHK